MFVNRQFANLYHYKSDCYEPVSSFGPVTGYFDLKSKLLYKTYSDEHVGNLRLSKH